MPEQEIPVFVSDAPPSAAENATIEIAQPEPAETPAPELVAPPQAPEPRKKYSSFYEAWPNVAELRRYTTRQCQPRLGMPSSDVEIANKLIEEYKNG